MSGRRVTATVLTLAALEMGAGRRAYGFSIDSPAFPNGAAIPVQHSCDGQDHSPPLRWRDAPAATRSFVLIVDDPDAPGGTWTHWVLYDVAATRDHLAGAVPPRESLDDGARQGRNDFHNPGYGGPCPPPGKPHRYVFTLYALDAPIGLPPLAGTADVQAAMQGHVLARAVLVGTYQRR